MHGDDGKNFPKLVADGGDESDVLVTVAQGRKQAEEGWKRCACSPEGHQRRESSSGETEARQRSSESGKKRKPRTRKKRVSRSWRLWLHEVDKEEEEGATEMFP
jgi:hypothetical protein